MDTRAPEGGDAWTGNRMRWTLAAALVAVCGGTAGAQIGAAVYPAASTRAAPAARPAAAQTDSARALLQRMTRRLAGARTFTVDAMRQMDAGLLEGREAADSAGIQIAVRRPDRVHIVSRGPGVERHFYYDGRNVTVFDATRKLYAIAPVRGTIDDMIRALDERYSFVPPLAEFLSNDPWSFMGPQVATARMAGVRVLNGRTCRGVAATGQVASATLWVGADDALPCGLVATFTQMEGTPGLRAAFANWNLDAQVADSRFSFVPPPGARQIPMMPLSAQESGL